MGFFLHIPFPPPEIGRAFDDSKWRTVHLPHDYVVEGTFAPNGDTGHGSLPKPIGFYRKTFTPPESMRGKSVWIDFEVYSPDGRDVVCTVHALSRDFAVVGSTDVPIELSGADTARETVTLRTTSRAVTGEVKTCVLAP